MREEMQDFLDRLLSIKAGIELRVEEIAELHETAAASIEDVASEIAGSLEDLAAELDSIHGELEDFADFYDAEEEEQDDQEWDQLPIVFRGILNRLSAIEEHLGMNDDDYA